MIDCTNFSFEEIVNEDFLPPLENIIVNKVGTTVPYNPANNNYNIGGWKGHIPSKSLKRKLSDNYLSQNQQKSLCKMNFIRKHQPYSFIEDDHSLLTGFEMPLTWSHHDIKIINIDDILIYFDKCDQSTVLLQNIGNYGNDLIITNFLKNTHNIVIFFDIHVRSLLNITFMLKYLSKKTINENDQIYQLNFDTNVSYVYESYINMLRIETNSKYMHDYFWFNFPIKDGVQLWYSPFFQKFTNKEPNTIRGGWYISDKLDEIMACDDFIKLIQLNIKSTINSEITSDYCSSQDSNSTASNSNSVTSSPIRTCFMKEEINSIFNLNTIKFTMGAYPNSINHPLMKLH